MSGFFKLVWVDDAASAIGTSIGLGRRTIKKINDGIFSGKPKTGDLLSLTQTSKLNSKAIAEIQDLQTALRKGDSGTDLSAKVKPVAKTIANNFADSIDDLVESGKKIFDRTEDLGRKARLELEESISAFLQKGITPDKVQKFLDGKNFYKDLGDAIRKGNPSGLGAKMQNAFDSAWTDFVRPSLGSAFKCKLSCLLTLGIMAGVATLFIKSKIDVDRKNAYEGKITKLDFSETDTTLEVTHSPGIDGMHGGDQIYFQDMNEQYEWLEDGEEKYGGIQVKSRAKVLLDVPKKDDEDDDSRDTCETGEKTNMDECGTMRIYAEFWKEVAWNAYNFGKGLGEAILGLGKGLVSGLNFNLWWILGPSIAIAVIVIFVFIFRMLPNRRR